MKVYLARLGVEQTVDEPVATMERLASADRFVEHEIVDDPTASDLILFCQCHMLPRDWRLIAIRDHPLTRSHPGRVMVYDERDRPWCALPGVYVSMPARSFDSRYQRACGYFPPVDSVDVAEERELLFSFVGSPSSRCREQLFELRHPRAAIEEVRGFTFYDSGSREFTRRRQHFRSIMSRSRFVLCPRGKGTSSIRLYEALAHGCVPVIISDDWVAPEGPDWASLSIRWPEKDAGGLVEVLEHQDGRWLEMSRAARAAYEQFFACDVAFHRMVENCSGLLAQGEVASFPAKGVRGHAFVAAGIDVARWRTLSGVRRTAKRVLRRLGVVR